jgi:hypothetical protein
VVAELTCSLQRTDRLREPLSLSRAELLTRLTSDAGQLP